MNIKKISVLIIAFVLLCGCNNNASSSNNSNTYTEKYEILQSDNEALSAKSGNDSLEAAVQTTEQLQGNSDFLSDTFFTPVLSEEDIEYMGIPYKELDPEQFVQLWAQCTRECNVQRLYVLSDKYKSEEENIEWMKSLLYLEMRGRMLHGYYDVVLHQIDDAPQGYYDRDETEERFYTISFKNKMYEKGAATYEGDSETYISLKKVDGFWRNNTRVLSQSL